MQILMKYLAKSRTGVFLYRRRVPGHLIDVIGQRELKRSLDTREEAVAIARYATANEWAEAASLCSGVQVRPRARLYSALILNERVPLMCAASRRRSRKTTNSCVAAAALR